MKDALLDLASRLGGERLLRWRNRARLPILMYHGVVEQPLEPFCWHQLPLAPFRRQLEWVARRYRVLPLEDALGLHDAGRLPERCCAVTFDDGYRNVATLAAPVLRELGLPATVFLVTDLVGTSRVSWPDRVWLGFARTDAASVDLGGLGLDRLPLDSPAAKATAIDAVLDALKATPAPEKDRYVDDLTTRLDVDAAPEPGPFEMLSWEEVRALDAEGLVTFGPHSRTHEILSRCDDAAVEWQVVGSQAVLADRLERPPRVFAYPNGGAADFDERARAAVREAGLPWALSTELGLLGDDADPSALPRVCVGADLSFPRFRWLCAGLT